MGYKKQIKGDGNEASEQLSHNRVSIHFDGAAPLLFVAFLMALVTAAIAWLVAHFAGLLLISLLVALLVVAAGTLWLFGVFIFSRTGILLAERRQAAITAAIAHATDHYIVWCDPNGEYQFRGSVVITENRQFLPKEVSPPSQQEAILTCYDQGMSGRAIEKWLKDNGTKVAYREIAKTLDLYRPDWNKKAVVNADPPKEDV